MRNQILTMTAVLVAFVTIKSFSKPVAGYYKGIISHQNKTWHIAVTFNEKAVVDFIEISGFNRLFELNIEGDKIHFERQQPAPRPPLIFDGKIAGDSITGTFSGIGINDARFVIRQSTPFVFEMQEIDFQHDSISLSGTLLLPQKAGKYPAVIFTHGSNPETRDLYFGSALQFVKAGIACLIYDKRGIGKSKGGNYRESGFTDFARDALAGLEKIKNHQKIDSKKIGIFGHSQGGWIAPTAANLSKDVAFVITSAASPVNAADQSVYHRKMVMQEEGFDSTAIATAAAIRQRLNQATKQCFTDTAAARRMILKVTEEINKIKTEAWFASSALPEIPYPGCPNTSVMELLFREPSEIWSKVKVPVYLAWGDADKVVPFKKFEIITNALLSSGNKSFTTKFWKSVDHFTYVVNDTNQWDFPREQKGYFSEMAAWTLSITK